MVFKWQIRGKGFPPLRSKELRVCSFNSHGALQLAAPLVYLPLKCIRITVYRRFRLHFIVETSLIVTQYWGEAFRSTGSTLKRKPPGFGYIII